MRLDDIGRRLLRPDTVPASGADRTPALGVLDAAGLDGDELRARTDAVQAATTRNDLYLALEGLDAGVPPWGVTTALRVAAVGWIAMTAVQIVVWLAVAVGTGGLDAPWWLYSTVGGAGVVGALWWVNESYHRVPGRRPTGALA
ncbi:DUF1707 domain-containing protein [Jiangella alba]|uniref:DUF1707 domain-containing protein n=1 Tax=Jiangella alba TaxID=561176 RepID=A0A1H5PW60_9ACTN|nr:DUF1707 domain-containing protein [Jiangella alba]SEF18080.1 hypothetical protein SAMN04488561_6211 [Jiangella alba]